MAASSTTIADEADFIRRVKEFHADAWDELYDAYFPRMYRYLYAHVGDRDVAEDLAAQVFEEACKGIRRFHYRGVPLASWLYKVAHNVMVDWKRRRKRRPEVQAQSDITVADPTEPVAERDELLGALAKLTPEQRQVVILRHIEGHSSASAGAIMGKKENAIRALEFRALAALRRAIQRAREEGEGS